MQSLTIHTVFSSVFGSGMPYIYYLVHPSDYYHLDRGLFSAVMWQQAI